MFYPYLVIHDLAVKLESDGWTTKKNGPVTHLEIPVYGVVGFEAVTLGISIGTLNTFWYAYLRFEPECPLWGATRRYLDEIRPLLTAHDIALDVDGSLLYLYWSFLAPDTSAEDLCAKIDASLARYSPYAFEVAASVCSINHGQDKVDADRHVELLVEQFKLSKPTRRRRYM